MENVGVRVDVSCCGGLSSKRFWENICSQIGKENI